MSKKDGILDLPIKRNGSIKSDPEKRHMNIAESALIGAVTSG